MPSSSSPGSMMTVSGAMYPDTCPSESVDLVGDGNVVLDARVALDKGEASGNWFLALEGGNFFCWVLRLGVLL